MVTWPSGFGELTYDRNPILWWFWFNVYIIRDIRLSEYGHKFSSMCSWCSLLTEYIAHRSAYDNQQTTTCAIILTHARRLDNIGKSNIDAVAPIAICYNNNNISVASSPSPTHGIFPIIAWFECSWCLLHFLVLTDTPKPISSHSPLSSSCFQLSTPLKPIICAWIALSLTCKSLDKLLCQIKKCKCKIVGTIWQVNLHMHTEHA